MPKIEVLIKNKKQPKEQDHKTRSCGHRKLTSITHTVK